MSNPHMGGLDHTKDDEPYQVVVLYSLQGTSFHIFSVCWKAA